MREGRHLEPIARGEYEKITGHYVAPQSLKHPKYDWVMGSLDGLTFDRKRMVEIKCGKGTYDKVSKDIVPKDYIWQVQHYLWVTGLPNADFYVYRPDENPILRILERDNAMIAEMKDAEEYFYHEYMLKNIPPPMTDKDHYIDLDENSELSKFRPEFLKAELEYKIAKEKYKDKKKELIILCENRSVESGGVRITKYHLGGNIDYTKIPELEGVDLEKYRKKSSLAWRITSK